MAACKFDSFLKVSVIVLVGLFLISFSAAAVTISDCQGLQNMQNDFGSDYILTQDIDCSVTNIWNGGAGFEPIGPSTLEGDYLNQGFAPSISFTGTLDGQGYSISNLKINRPTKDFTGLFRNLNGATISNLNIVNANINGGWNTAILAGSATNSLIQGVSVTGTVSSSRGNIGGLVGGLRDTTLESSFAGVDVTAGKAHAGGLFAAAWSNTVINNSYATGDVASSYQYVGGLGGVISDISEVHNSYATGDVIGSSKLGGLIGYQVTSSKIYNSFSTGKISSQWGGGFVGTMGPNARTYNSAWYKASDSPVATSCDRSTRGDCSAIIIKNDAGWFKDSANIPMSSWDASIWKFEGESYPTLKNSGRSCTDTDEGLDFLSKGDLYLDEEFVGSDFCTGEVLTEYYCGHGDIITKEQGCPRGCENFNYSSK